MTDTETLRRVRLTHPVGNRRYDTVAQIKSVGSANSCRPPAQPAYSSSLQVIRETVPPPESGSNNHALNYCGRRTSTRRPPPAFTGPSLVRS